MINRRTNWVSVGLCAVMLSGVAVVVCGCTGEDEQQVQAPPPPPPPPPPPAAPAVTPVDQLMEELNIDKRVMLPEEKAPGNDTDRKAVLVFFDAMARGNAQSFKGMLPLAEQMELNSLVESGAWKQTTGAIKKIDVQTGDHAGNKCALAIIEVSGGTEPFQPQLWYYTTEEDSSKFEAAAAPPGIMDRLGGDDLIAAWHKILDEEEKLAMEPDEEVQVAQKNLDDVDKSDGSSGSSAPNTPGTLKPPPTVPIAPPRAPNPGGR